MLLLLLKEKEPLVPEGCCLATQIEPPVHSVGNPALPCPGVIEEAVRKQMLTFTERLFWTQ